MNRDILFRGKRLDNGEWVYGDLQTQYTQPRVAKWYTVDPKTVGQYIGLMDKYLTKIFEHDIVKNGRGLVGYVSFLQQSMGYHIVYKNTDERLGHRHRGGHYEVDVYLEVIGNIHDNPKLLEGLRYDMQK